MLTPQPEVQRGCQHRAAAVSQTVHHADNGLGRRRYIVGIASPGPVLLISLFLSEFLGPLPLFVNVPSGRESPVAGSGQNDAPNFIVRVHGPYRFVQLCTQLSVHSVQDFRAIQRNDRHPFFFVHQDVLVCHSVLL